MKIDHLVQTILSRRNALPQHIALLVAISGIDGSGKSTLATQLAQRLNKNGINSVLITLDAWHNPPEKRFGKEDPGGHFYRNAFRFNELFDLVVNPLRLNRALQVTVELTRLPENDSYLHRYDFGDVDVILLEGIFLLKRELRESYDLAFWVECSFEEALRRAVLRNQEGLSEEQIIEDYKRIYFPAQRIHLEWDNPKSNVDGVVDNN
jgi:uridine kinase